MKLSWKTIKNISMPLVVCMITIGINFADAEQGLTAEKARAYLLKHHQYSESPESERRYIESCFTKENPFRYCLVYIKGLSWRFYDQNLNSPYDIYIFDNGPDYESEGYYRITKDGKIGFANAVTGKIAIEPIYDCAHPFRDGKAEVGFKCESIQDGEHFYWTSDEWLYLKPPRMIDK